jgi:hypothetical protein
MMRTGQQVEDDVYEFLAGSPLRSFIGGEVYRFGMRPRDSVQEDAVVKFVTGLAGEVQTGVVVINIYVPDIDAFHTGVLVRNIHRCKAIEIKAGEWVRSLTTGRSDYRFSPAQTIYTEEEPAIKQHFVTVRIKFELLII